MMSSAMLCAYFPRDVPPNFWMTQGAFGGFPLRAGTWVVVMAVVVAGDM